MDRCALFVDAGYVLADGAMAVHGTRRRESVSWDYAGLAQLFGNLAMERTSLPLLRSYWYEATVEGRRSAEHDILADLPGVKLRVAKARPGRREGVEAEMHRDLTTLARNKAVSDVMVVSAEEDLTQVVAYIQDMGLRVSLLHIAVDGEETAPRALRQESDDFMEITATQLRPYVELISGAEPPRPDEAASAPEPQAAANGAVNANAAVNGNGYNGNGQVPSAGQAAGYQQAPYQQAPYQQALYQQAGYQQAGELPEATEQAMYQAPQPAAADASQPDPAQPDPAQPDPA